jgi:CRISPR-associated protein Csb3
MNETLTLPGTWQCAFDHLAAYGAASIAVGHGYDAVRLRWTDDLESVVQLSGLDWADLAQAVHDHATAHAQDSWVQADGVAKGQEKALFSPRVPTFEGAEPGVWFAKRADVIDALPHEWALLDKALIGALGCPSYWSFDQAKKILQDYGASRWEMKTRNRGEEFVGNRLRKLAASVAARQVDDVLAGLHGDGPVVDEAGDNKADSRTPTGLMPPRATDNARAWCALWGMSVMGLTPMPIGASRTTCHRGATGEGEFYLPVMVEWWPLGRLRTVVRSAQLRGVVEDHATDAGPNVVAEDWLRDRGVGLIAVFPVHRGGSASAPERWAELGHAIHLGRR